jgi:hypothetical protein
MINSNDKRKSLFYKEVTRTYFEENMDSVVFGKSLLVLSHNSSSNNALLPPPFTLPPQIKNTI